MNVQFHKPYFSGNELKYITDIFKRGLSITGDGYYTAKATEWLEKKLAINKVLLTTSCTSALEMAVRILKLNPGDEVILPSFTFTSTANAVLLNSGLKIRFADIQTDTLNIEPDDIAAKINKKTKALIIMHYAGVSCDMDRILKIAKDNKLGIIEDAAQAIGAKYKDKFLGTLGDFGCFSFHETKNITSGEGGALCINIKNLNLQEEAEVMREKGTNRTKFIRGEIEKYTWVNTGSSYLPSDLLAAVLFAQLENMDKIQSRRMRIYDFYKKNLSRFEKKGYVKLPVIPEYAKHNAHTFFLLFNKKTERNFVLSFLKQNGVDARFHYIPLHLSPMGKKLGYKLGDLPLTEKMSETLLRLPLYAGMKGEEVKYVINIMEKMFRDLF
ncbi:dTDP-4-amino-4,6-dideoxygalactose transaminase [Candidatus Roizmanbacteria bacterium RIFCSPLOWO2_01_FULL_37_12]|uniref:dTDP-4-amino-4,6-dideoxygalactose transaminase n=1 Tax=Candidatus Roizmanbacteria bacterium RIFCSPLOWO2_01_FULL_37_12 TaxID=1802056 RepID=A0A1F7IBF0_9BACT|nr:MAG: dTDP-4-amino-4,6-dideoxygalactose transaminase [Candidatus Roizmanbacteria bacterium RIFCSPHIGHO2_02_FULL_37_9b]OGK40684.1 MAG: dTDP-4-amino-4,6-dideoxygalactose transaminase [Candidatus Roizmanbacteria bacterium RIFCSPLOWO2_01_FULL_37_12]